MRRSRQRTHREKGRTWDILIGLWVRPDCQFKPKEWGFSRSPRILPKESMGLGEGEGTGRVRKLLIIWGVGKSHSELTLFVTLRAIISC